MNLMAVYIRMTAAHTYVIVCDIDDGSYLTMNPTTKVARPFSAASASSTKLWKRSLPPKIWQPCPEGDVPLAQKLHF